MQPTLELVPTLGFARRYTVRQDGRDVAQFTLGSLRDSRPLRIDGVSYELHCKGDAQRPVEAYTLVHEGARVARASKSTALGNGFEMQLDERVFQVVRRGRRCLVAAQGQKIGSIAPRHPFTRRADISMLEDLSLPVIVFVAVLVALLRNRPGPEAADSPVDLLDVIDLFD